MIQIHGVPPSPYVRKVRAFLAEKGVEYELVTQQPMGQSPEYMAKSPLGKIPCLEDGDFVLPDSSAICAYLEKSHPDPALYPDDPHAFGRALWYEEYADSKLAQTCAGVFFQRIVRKLFFKQEPDEAIVKQTLEEELPPVLDYLQGEIGAADALVGGRFSIADLAVVTQLQQLRLAGEDVDAERWPALHRYLDVHTARPSFKACIEGEHQMLAALAG